MSNDTNKGLSPLAWAAIGCGALVLVAVVAVAAVGGFAYFKVKEHVEVDDQGKRQGQDAGRRPGVRHLGRRRLG